MVTKQWLQRALFILLIGAASSQWGGNANRKKETCNKPSLKNGKIKWRSNGRVVKYSCNKDYILVGESTSTCLQGEWTADTPVCAARGCPVLPNPTSGRFVPSNGGAVLRLECNPGYYPSDSPMLYCDRFEWNGTSPSCQPSGVAPSFSCDFEQDDLCGWSQDASDEFDWTWQSYMTPSYHLGTGPSFDHTLGANKGGHYLFIESSSPRSLNDTARLYSPVYGPPSSGSDGGSNSSSSSSSNEQCFTFWYHMYGSDSGRLHVYVKAESVAKLSQVNPTFVRIGDQGNVWRQGYLPLPTNLTVENFQVVIEGVRGTGYVGDTAIDDVQVVSGADCLAAKERMLAEKSGPSTAGSNRPSTLPPKMSCFSRCSGTATAAVPSSSADLCGCRDDCLLTNSCCSDYATFCLTESVTNGTSTTTQSSSTMMTTFAISTIATLSTPMATVPTSTASTLVTTMPSTTKMSTPLLTTTTVRPSTTTTPITTSTLPPTTATKETTSTTTTTTTTSTSTVLPSTTTTTEASPSPNSAAAVTAVPATVPSDDFASEYFSSRQTTSPPTRDGVQGDESAVPGASRITDDGSSQSSRNRDRQQQQQPGGMVAAVAGGVGGCILLISTVALIGVYVRRRRFLHRIGGGGQQQQQDLLAEDSDVRYLKDEDDVQLDLTEATPSSTRQFSNFERL